MVVFKKIGLICRIIIGLIVGTLAGLFIPQVEVIGLFGTFFINALKAIAPALVLVLVMNAIVNASGNRMDRFRKIIFLYLLSTMTAALTSVFICFIFPVKMHFLQTTPDSIPVPGDLNKVATLLLSNLIENPINALLNDNYISILFWGIIFGVAIKKKGAEGPSLFISQLAEALTTIVRWIIAFAPIGIMGIIFSIVSKAGLSIFEDYSRLRMLLTSLMIIVALVINPLLVFLIMRRNPYPLVFKCLKESGITAFFTRSSAANIPVNLELCEKLKLDKEVCSVTIPLGAAINMNGAAVTITVLTLTAVNTLGIEVSLSGAIMVSFLAALSACGASGVTGGSILLIPLALSMFGISKDVAMQVVAAGFTLGVLQDAIETAINSSGDVLFTAAAEFGDRIKSGEELPKL